MRKKILGLVLAAALTAAGTMTNSTAKADSVTTADQQVKVTCDASSGYFFLATPVSDNIVNLVETGNLNASSKMIYKGKFKLKCYGIIPEDKYIDIDLTDAKARDIKSKDGATAKVDTDVYGVQDNINSNPTVKAGLLGYCCKDANAGEKFINLEEKEADNKFIVYECTSVPDKSANYEGNIELHLSLKNR